MAKLSSLFKFEGTLDDFTVVKKTGVVKRKGGLSKGKDCDGSKSEQDS
ncbi:MAG: hypothetical protein IPJ39_22670 [Saprospiraceae bacterium]|nr:hypothetical protein [Saprospiraceae bacterium]